MFYYDETQEIAMNMIKKLTPVLASKFLKYEKVDDPAGEEEYLFKTPEGKTYPPTSTFLIDDAVDANINIPLALYRQKKFRDTLNQKYTGKMQGRERDVMGKLGHLLVVVGQDHFVKIANDLYDLDKSFAYSFITELLERHDQYKETLCKLKCMQVECLKENFEQYITDHPQEEWSTYYLATDLYNMIDRDAYLNLVMQMDTQHGLNAIEIDQQNHKEEYLNKYEKFCADHPALVSCLKNTSKTAMARIIVFDKLKAEARAKEKEVVQEQEQIKEDEIEMV